MKKMLIAVGLVAAWIGAPFAASAQDAPPPPHHAKPPPPPPGPNS